MRCLLNFLNNIFIGILIGAGAIIPGISSGVFCIIFGIYEKLVNSLLHFFSNIKSNIFFLLPLSIGGFIGVFIFGNIVKFFFYKYQMQCSFIFIGLILGSIPAVFKSANSSSFLDLKKFIPTIISFIIGISLIILEKYFPFSFVNIILNKNSFSLSYFNISYLVFAGIIMSIGVVVPGISSTVLLMCLGIYRLYISCIANLNFAILIPIGIGLLVGSIICLKIMDWLFKTHHSATINSIVGFSVGSVFVLFPNFTLNFVGITSIFLLIFSFIISYKLSKIK